MKTKAAPAATIDQYIAGSRPEVRKILTRIRSVIRRAAPEAAETIKYQVPTFTLNGNLVHFAAFQAHIGLYPTPSGMAHFKAELAPYESGKGSVRFPLDEPIPYDLIERIVAFRRQENLGLAGQPARKRPVRRRPPR